MTESRTELVIWVNNLLAMQYTKVEQLGTGVAYSQIIDSIYGDVHLAKIKFKARHEYEFIDNYKVLQRSFEKHKFQDNLEFLQWIKLFWDANYQGGVYDAVGRRQRGINKAAAVRSSPAPPLKMRHGRIANHSFSDLASYASLSSTSSSTAATSLETPIDTATGVRVNVYSGRHCQSPSSSSSASVVSLDNKAKRTRTLASHPRSPSPMSSSNRIIMDLNQQICQLQSTIDSLHVEKDFYHRKLDKVEQTFTASNHNRTLVSSPLHKIGTILGATEVLV
ncbi:hypothetical protein [Absidia glauca]|uniref:EB1 C-terminal domain-containing protein n=1 Tax=Absidia glauca TaxID=4829 RepID=A0A163JSI5_ABSGL|nr:hypothetical protein [Absidia glauca]